MAGLFDNDLILPGVITEIIPDYTQEYDTSETGSTESVTIIGTAFNGPVGKVVQIASPEQAKYIFGDSFDAKTRREASLVAEIYDAWDRGCRTIYAVRVSGKEISKDYKLATETNLKLRVSGIFPSNENKDVYLNYSAVQAENGDAGIIKVFKAPHRANMKEKMQGLVISEAEMLVNEIKLAGYGLTKDSRLVDAINIVNGSESNNVLRLALVDENGADVTLSSKEAQSLCLGVMFPGLYTVGRDKAASGVTVKTEVNYTLSSDSKPHTNYQEAVWVQLEVNSDVSAPYPIFAKVSNDLSSLLPVATDVNGNWLKPIGLIDKIAIKDKLDYEEVELDEFDLYKRLGSGFAQTAKIIELKNADGGVRGYKVTVPESNDVNKVIGINDGIYSMLENHSTNYTVLGAANVQSRISGKLPRKEAFKKRRAGVINLAENGVDVVELIAKIDEKDFSTAKNVTVELITVEEGINQSEILSKLDTSVKAKRIDTILADQVATTVLPEGTLCAVVGESDALELKKSVNGQLVASTENGVFVLKVAEAYKVVESTNGVLANKDLTAGTSIIATNGEIANVYVSDAAGVQPVCILGQLANKELEEDYTVCYIENLATGLVVNVYSTEAQWMTYSELVEKLNENVAFSSLFTANAITADTEVGLKAKGVGVDKGDSFYDITMYIPYTTSDNFGRHLAQHCMYTSLKTSPTHGIIGCGKLNSVNLSAVSEKVKEILEMDLDLYAKMSNGNNMLTAKNLPYPIGRCLSVPFIQYVVTTGNGYNYVSNGASGYAGMISTLPADRSSTNQAISLPTLGFELSNYQLSLLTAKGYVTVKKTTQGTVITDGITMAPVDSGYRRLSTAKIINIVDASLRRAIEPFIGTSDNLANRNSMNTAITSTLNKLKEKLINEYKFKIEVDPKAARLGIIKINYVVVPYNEIKEVRNTLSVQE